MSELFSEPFIGREYELSLLRNEIFNTIPEAGSCCSVIGPNQIGKTTLVRKLAEEFKKKQIPNIYYFSLDFMSNMTVWTFWSAVVEQFAGEITKEKLCSMANGDERTINSILAIYNFFAGTEGSSSAIVQMINQLFKNYTRLGLVVILVVDEFDRAIKAFPVASGDGGFFQQLFGLSPRAIERYNLRILLICRRRPRTIAHHMAEGSDFESAFPPIALRGFSDQELEEYFRSFDAPDVAYGVLEEETKQDIIGFCGRNPGLLMKMRKHIKYCEKGTTPDVGRIYCKNGMDMQTVFDSMTTLLREEYLDQACTQNCINAFAQTFIGPVYEEYIPEKISQMYTLGILTKVDEGNRNIYEMAGLDNEKLDKSFDYEPLSPYYVEYLRNRVLPDELDESAKLLNCAEKEVRKVIHYVLKMHYPDDWENILDQYTSEVKEKFARKLYKLAIKHDASSRNITFTNLDVMGFLDYQKIIVAYWENMKSYFQSYADTELFKEELAFLNEARNCYAHLNSKILDAESVKRLKEICTKLIEDINDGYEGKIRVTETLVTHTAENGSATSRRQASNVVMPSDEEIRGMIGRSIIFCCESRGQNGNLRGTIKNSGYKASMPKVYASTLANPIGREISAIVERWNDNPNALHFTLKL